jgi:hypothetical protein
VSGVGVASDETMDDMEAILRESPEGLPVDCVVSFVLLGDECFRNA